MGDGVLVDVGSDSRVYADRLALDSSRLRLESPGLADSNNLTASLEVGLVAAD